MHRLILFGGIHLEGPSGPPTGRIVQRRQLALLALLARTAHTPMTRERAVGVLWPDCPEGRARARLSDALYVIRQELGEDAVMVVGEGLRLNPDRVWSDVGAFEEAVGAGRWEEAVELYEGPFLEGFHPNGNGGFERWVDEERRSLAERYRRALETLATDAEEAGDRDTAVTWWKRRAAEERTNSRVALRLMQALAESGNVAGALQHARIHEALLEEELQLALPAEVQALVGELAATSGEDVPRTRDPERANPAKGAHGGRYAGDPVRTGVPEEAEEGGPPVDPDTGGGPSELPDSSDPRPPGSPATVWGGGRRRLAFTGAAGVLFLASGMWLSSVMGGDDTAWARDQAVPEIEELVGRGLFDSAWTVARRARALDPADPELGRLLPEFTWLWPELHTDPPGARVLRRPYGDPDAPWEELGTTPLDTFRLPLGATVLRIELEGHRPAYTVPDDYLDQFPVFTLDPPNRLPEGMVRVPGGEVALDEEVVELSDFFMARYPVTNREYMLLVEAGGYQNPEFWEHPFVLEGDTLSWEEGMARFTDRTGRPGPATWEVGRYPDGTGDHPVGGVSWYEAAAYSAFAGTPVPGVHHWHRAFGSPFFGEHMIPESNLHSDGPTPVGAHDNMGPFGTFDMAGNVREWTWNERGEERFILGAGWDDPEKLALHLWHSRHAFDRSVANGFRVVRYLDDGPELARALAPLPPRAEPDFLAEANPPSDEEFEIFRRMYAYDPVPLEARVETVDTSRHWIRETVSFNAAYEGARVHLHLHLPRDGSQPYQTVVYWPGAGAQTFASIDAKTDQHTPFIVQSGRALAFPVLKGTLERLGEVEGPRPPVASVRFRNLRIQQVQDVLRTLDYLERRDDVDADGLAYYGWSWGGGVAPLVLAVEPRLRAAVLHTAGLGNTRPLPEVDPLNFLSRVTVPVLMLNGSFDATVPVDTHGWPFFELLGTAPADKRLIEFEGGHFAPRPLLIRESLDWLDRYLGPADLP
jgi:DNA-binding SARP family transcriptional activator